MVYVRATGAVLRLEESSIPPEKRFCFYDQIHTTGMDIHHRLTARAALTLGKDMTWRDYAQVRGAPLASARACTTCKAVPCQACVAICLRCAPFYHTPQSSTCQGAYRMRKIAKGQTIELLVTPEVAQLVHRDMTKNDRAEVIRQIDSDESLAQHLAQERDAHERRLGTKWQLMSESLRGGNDASARGGSELGSFPEAEVKEKRARAEAIVRDGLSATATLVFFAFAPDCPACHRASKLIQHIQQSTHKGAPLFLSPHCSCLLTLLLPPRSPSFFLPRRSLPQASPFERWRFSGMTALWCLRCSRSCAGRAPHR